MSAQRQVSALTTYLGYDPDVAAIRLAADVAHTHLSRGRHRPMRISAYERRIIRYRDPHWHELPDFVRWRARDKGIDLGDNGRGHRHREWPE